MAGYAISDIHGDLAAFNRALKMLMLRKEDTLFLLGDFIDRGLDSKGVIDRIFELQVSGIDVRCIRGNHEEMLLEGLANPSKSSRWLKNGGVATLVSFGIVNVKDIPEVYVDWMKHLPYYHTWNDFILVHAGLNMHAKNPFRETQDMIWIRDWRKFYDPAWLGDRTVIHGHTPLQRVFLADQFSSSINVFCIDNGCFKEQKGFGMLAVLDLGTLEIGFV